MIIIIMQKILVGVIGVLFVLAVVGPVHGEEEKERNLDLDEFVPEIVLRLNPSSPKYASIHLTPCNPSYILSLQIPQGSVDDDITITINGTVLDLDQSHTPIMAHNITVTGNWKKMNLTLLVTLLYNPPADEETPKEWMSCENGYYIPYGLKCNGRQNCPNGKDETGCTTNPSKGDDNSSRMSLYDVQYLLTILLAGLFFILSPICIVIFLFYHRRMSAARAELEQRGPGRIPVEVFTTSSPAHDVPPSYDDVHQLKTPPPPFHMLPQRPSSSSDAASSSSSTQ